MVLPATVSYSIAFLAGIVLAYFMQRYFVFKQRGRDYGFVLTLMIYCLQYGIGIALVFVWTDYFKLPALFAPLVSIVVTLPITYFLSQKVFSDPD